MSIALIVASGCGAGHDDLTPAIHALGQRGTRPADTPARMKPVTSAPFPACEGDERRPARVETRTLGPGAKEFVTVQAPSVGVDEVVALCVYGFDDRRTVTVTIDGVARPLRHTFPPVSVASRGVWMVLVDPGVRPGPHRVLARQGSKLATTIFTVSSARAALPRIGTSAAFGANAGDRVEILAVGQHPSTTETLDIYAYDESDYQYWSSIPARVDANGVATATLTTRPSDANNYLVAVHGARAQMAEVQLSGRVVGRPVALPPGEHPHSVFEGRQKPPPGVARTIQFFQGGGDDPCDVPHSHAPSIVVLRIPLRYPPGERVSPSALRTGDQIIVCTYHFSRKRPVRLSAVGPSGRLTAEVLPSGETGTTHSSFTRLLGPHTSTGAYRFVATQGRLTARKTVRVRRAMDAAAEVIPSSDGLPTVFGVGLPPGQAVRISVYREPTGGAEGNPAAGVRYEAGFVGSFPARANAEGILSAVLGAAANDTTGCYIVTVSYSDVVLSDARGTDDTVCLPYSAQMMTEL